MPDSPAATNRYHHGNLREALIDSAAQAIVSQAAEELSLRALARAAGVSQTAPYRHFSDRNELLSAVSERGYVQLIDRLTATIATASEDPEQQVKAAAQCYIGFAIENPSLFKLMFGPLLQPTNQFPTLHEKIRACNKLVQSMLARGVQSGSIISEDLRYLTNTAWAGIHGLATLVIDMPEVFKRHIDMQRQIEISVRTLLT